MAPVAVTKLMCDGDTYKCTANLVNREYIFIKALKLTIFIRTMAMGAGSHNGEPPSSTPATQKPAS